jgi:hypothetical protein
MGRGVRLCVRGNQGAPTGAAGSGEVARNIQLKQRSEFLGTACREAVRRRADEALASRRWRGRGGM